jgi:hypothetical protein
MTEHNWNRKGMNNPHGKRTGIKVYNTVQTQVIPWQHKGDNEEEDGDSEEDIFSDRKIGSFHS